MHRHAGSALVWLATGFAGGAAHAQAPIEYETAKVVAKEGEASDLAGTSVATSGDVIVVGVPYASGGSTWADPGAAYVFRWNGVAWDEEQKLAAGSGDDSLQFGYDVAVEDDLIVVGAPYSSGGRQESHLTGAAHVYRWTGSAWVEEQKLVASDARSESKFGFSVDVSGDVIVIGENWDYAGLTAPHGRSAPHGAAYVYRWQGSAWIEEQKLVSSAGQAYTDFGFSVAVHGDEILVGEPFFDVPGGEPYNQGAVSAFRWNGSGWLEVQRLLASDGADSDYFGRTVDLDQDVAVVGAPFVGPGSYPLDGAVYVYRRATSGWVEEQKLVGGRSEFLLAFGSALALDGDAVLVGASNQVIDPDLAHGVGYLFRWNGVTWVEEQWLVDSDGQPLDGAGISVALSGAVAVLGVAWDDVGTSVDQGSACVFDVQGAAWTWLGQPLGGTSGVPVLTASGDLSPGSAAAFHLAHAPPSAAGYLILGLSKASMGFKGGVLVPNPDEVVGPFATNEQGDLELVAHWPPAVASGFTFWAQAWIVDMPGSPELAASNAIAGTTP